MNASERITAGVVEFADPALLLTGNKARLHELANLLGAEGAELFWEKALLNPIGVELNLHMGVRQTQLLKTGDRVDWFISPADAKVYAELVRAVADSDKPSHTYLDVPGNVPLDIIVSKDEYDPTTIFIGT